MMNMTHNSIGKCSFDDNGDRANYSTWMFLLLEFVGHYLLVREGKYFSLLLNSTLFRIYVRKFYEQFEFILDFLTQYMEKNTTICCRKYGCLILKQITEI